MTQKKLHLQGLRGLAIIAVILFHFFPKWCPNGYLGVDQFFLLSGFLMTMMLRRHNSLNITVILDFLYRRVKRIVPLYYLITALTLVSINLMPKSAFNTNFTSGIRAILFVTNLIRPLGNEDYAEKLGLAVDMFTHTWSLALEMQFYLLFPIIYIFVRYFEDKKNYAIFTLGFISLLFHLLSDSFLSFNSVFSRIWQFLAGVFVFLNSIEQDEMRDSEKLSLIVENVKSKDRTRLCRVITAVSICSMTLLMFGPYVIEPIFGRLNIILLTSLIVYLGEGSLLLENQPIVFLGEISYCWYLVHWPIIALCKINGFTGELELFYSLIGSFVLSLVIHYGFERFYLKWKKITIKLIVLVLLLINGMALFQLHGKIPSASVNITRIQAKTMISNDSNEDFIFDSDHLGTPLMGYENMTNEERAKLNDDNNAKDISRLFTFPCIENTGQTRCQVGEIKNITGQPPLTLLVLGNSYAQNVMSLIHNECRDVFSSMYITAVNDCEPLYNTGRINDCIVDDSMFQEDAEKYKPDVLFIITRHVAGMKISKGTNPFDDDNFATAVKRLTALEKVVKKKIYILDAFPEVTRKIIKILNSYLRTGITFSDGDIQKFGLHYQIAKLRMARLIEGCSKCELIDYTTQFYINGEFKIYDPKYHVSFISGGLHFTPSGLERIRPLYRHICHHL